MGKEGHGIVLLLVCGSFLLDLDYGIAAVWSQRMMIDLIMLETDFISNQKSLEYDLP